MMNSDVPLSQTRAQISEDQNLKNLTYDNKATSFLGRLVYDLGGCLTPVTPLTVKIETANCQKDPKPEERVCGSVLATVRCKRRRRESEFCTSAVECRPTAEFTPGAADYRSDFIASDQGSGLSRDGNGAASLEFLELQANKLRSGCSPIRVKLLHEIPARADAWSRHATRPPLSVGIAKFS
ncbi:Uncharacterized protein Adt_34677 [Abeliophyllum distichum]|uniref:Uncharacterized protein n=1 Tax=Abeliophyllum distichum TaxID=126358 RepID=A0ABD1R0R9_9LAMI